MVHGWWQDIQDPAQRWQGLELTVGAGGNGQRTLEMVSGHRGRMSLWMGGEPLLWATVLEDHSGVWLIVNQEHPGQFELLPHVTSADVEAAKRAGAGGRLAWWSRYFAQRLASSTSPMLPARCWRLLPMLYRPPSAPCKLGQIQSVEHWCFHSPSLSSPPGFSWTLYGEDFPDLLNRERVSLIDWWWNGYLLRGRYAVNPDDSRLKWWRKKCREGSLPPVLVWYITGLASYVILDGHCRLQAAIEEGIPPDFLVLTELVEKNVSPDPERRDRIVKSIEQRLRDKPDTNIDNINQVLIGQYNDRYSYETTHSRAILGSGDEWEREVRGYLQRHGLDDFVKQVINRIE